MTFDANRSNTQPFLLDIVSTAILRAIRTIDIQKGMLECFIGSYALGGIKLQTQRHEGNGFFLFVTEGKISLATLGTPKQNLLPAVAVLADGGNVGLQNLAV